MEKVSTDNGQLTRRKICKWKSEGEWKNFTIMAN